MAIHTRKKNSLRKFIIKRRLLLDEEVTSAKRKATTPARSATKLTRSGRKRPSFDFGCRSISSQSFLSAMEEASPIRRRLAEPGNVELSSSSSISNDDSASNDDSKKRRTMHIRLGPLVISGAAIDRVMARLISFTSKLTMDTLRPLPLFMGVTGPSFCIAADAFSPPISLTRQSNKPLLEKVMSRLSRNLNYFATNYAFVAVCTIFVVALMHPGMLLYVGITWASWWLHLVIIREDVRLVIMEKDLNDVFTPKRRSWILTAWTVWVAAAKCFHPSIKGMAISGALVLFHALMRDPSKLGGDLVRSRSRALRESSPSNSDDGSEVFVECEDAV